MLRRVESAAKRARAAAAAPSAASVPRTDAQSGVTWQWHDAAAAGGAVVVVGAADEYGGDAKLAAGDGGWAVAAVADASSSQRVLAESAAVMRVFDTWVLEGHLYGSGGAVHGDASAHVDGDALSAVRALASRLLFDESAVVRARALGGLVSVMGCTRSVRSTLVAFTADTDERVRLTALLQLRRFVDDGDTARGDEASSAAAALAEVAISVIEEDSSAVVRGAALELLWLVSMRHASVRRVRVPEETLASAAFVYTSHCTCDASALVRERAGRVLGCLHQYLASARLLQALSKKVLEEDADATSAVASAATAAATLPAAEASGTETDGGAPSSRQALDSRFVASSAAGAFVHGLEDESRAVRLAAIESIANIGAQSGPFGRQSAAFLVDMFNDEVDSVRLVAIQSVERLAEHLTLDDKVLSAILSLLHDGSAAVRVAAHSLIGSLVFPGARAIVRCILACRWRVRHAQSGTDRETILDALARIGQRHTLDAGMVLTELGCAGVELAAELPTIDDPMHMCLLSFLAASLRAKPELRASVPPRLAIQCDNFARRQGHVSAAGAQVLASGAPSGTNSAAGQPVVAAWLRAQFDALAQHVGGVRDGSVSTARALSVANAVALSCAQVVRDLWRGIASDAGPSSSDDSVFEGAAAFVALLASWYRGALGVRSEDDARALDTIVQHMRVCTVGAPAWYRDIEGALRRWSAEARDALASLPRGTLPSSGAGVPLHAALPDLRWPSGASGRAASFEDVERVLTARATIDTVRTVTDARGRALAVACYPFSVAIGATLRNCATLLPSIGVRVSWPSGPSEVHRVPPADVHAVGWQHAQVRASIDVQSLPMTGDTVCELCVGVLPPLPSSSSSSGASGDDGDWARFVPLSASKRVHVSVIKSNALDA